MNQLKWTRASLNSYRLQVIDHWPNFNMLTIYFHAIFSFAEFPNRTFLFLSHSMENIKNRYHKFVVLVGVIECITEYTSYFQITHVSIKAQRAKRIIKHFQFGYFWILLFFNFLISFMNWEIEKSTHGYLLHRFAYFVHSAASTLSIEI